MQNSSILVIFIIPLLALGCRKKIETPQLEFNPEQITYVKYNVRNCSSNKVLTAYYLQTLPAGQEKLNHEINSDTSFVQDIIMNHPLYIDLYEGKGHAILFTVPNDTLIVNLDYSGNKPLVEAINFQGLTGAISKYLTFDRYYHRYPPKENQSIANFNSMIDSLYGQELGKIDSLGKSSALPNWFLNLEKNNIRYEREYLKGSQYSNRHAFYKQFFPREPDFLQNINVGNMDYYWLYNAIGSLATIRPDKYDSLSQQHMVTPQIILDIQQDNFDLVKDRLSENALSYYVASIISANFMQKKLLRLTPVEFVDRKQEIDDFLQYNAGLITDTLIYNHLMKEKGKAYQAVENRNILHEGENAPSFYLSDINGKYRRLSDYYGKLILLNFWGTYCAPCIKDIPVENRLVEQFSGEDFVLINICTDSNYEKWKQLIHTHNFMGVHLICKGNWEKNMRAEYNVYSVPHYTIIGHDGRIIKNNVVDSIGRIIAESL